MLLSKQYFKRERKTVLLLIPNNLSIKEKLTKTMTLTAIFHDDKKNFNMFLSLMMRAKTTS